MAANGRPRRRWREADRARARRSDSLWAEAMRRFRRHRLAMVGAVVLGIMVLAVVVGPFVYRVPIDEIDFRAKLQAPSPPTRSGPTTRPGVLARMLYGGPDLAGGGRRRDADRDLRGHGRGRGGRPARRHARQRPDAVDRPLPVAAPAAALPARDLSVPRLDQEGTRPGDGCFVLIVAVIGCLRWMPVARLVRAQFLSLREKEFVEAARALGCRRRGRSSATSSPTPSAR